MANRPWSQAEVEFLLAYREDRPTKWIAEQLGRTPHGVNRKIRTAHLWKNKRIAMSRKAKRVPEGQRLCRRCARILDCDQFYANKSASSGLQSHCKKCSVEMAVQWNLSHKERFQATSARSRRKRQYGLTADRYDALMTRQANECAICGRTNTTLNVDHDHATGRVRGLLCRSCNTALGGFGDSTERLEAAVAYLKRPPLDH